jgi:hypothetical protein
MSKSKPVSYLYCGWLHQADRPSEGGPLELVYTLEDVHASVFQMIDHGIETLRVSADDLRRCYAWLVPESTRDQSYHAGACVSRRPSYG